MSELASKIRVKMSAAEELAERIRKVKKREADGELEARALIKGLETLLEQQMGLQRHLDEQLAEGEVNDEEFKAARSHGASMLNCTMKLLRVVEKSAAEVKPRVEALQTCLMELDRYYHEKGKAADNAERLDGELENEEEQLDEERQRRIAARAAREATQESAGAPVETVPACTHCGEEREKSETHCGACSKHHKRYGAWPSQKVLKRRQEAKDGVHPG